MEDPAEQVILYTTSWCGYCTRLKREMESEGIGYREVDVDVDHSHDEAIKRAGGGYRTVPTIEIDGDLLVNPTIGQVKSALSET